jgi:hypothetical protein
MAIPGYNLPVNPPITHGGFLRKIFETHASRREDTRSYCLRISRRRLGTIRFQSGPNWIAATDISRMSSGGSLTAHPAMLQQLDHREDRPFPANRSMEARPSRN